MWSIWKPVDHVRSYWLSLVCGHRQGFLECSQDMASMLNSECRAAQWMRSCRCYSELSDLQLKLYKCLSRGHNCRILAHQNIQYVLKTSQDLLEAVEGWLHAHVSYAWQQLQKHRRKLAYMTVIDCLSARNRDTELTSWSTASTTGNHQAWFGLQTQRFFRAKISGLKETTDTWNKLQHSGHTCCNLRMFHASELSPNPKLANNNPTRGVRGVKTHNDHSLIV